MELKHQLAGQLRQLRLSGVLETLEARNRQAIDDKWSFLEFLSRILEDEVERRSQKQLHLRLRRGALNSAKTLEGFDFNFNPNLNRQQILELATCEFVRQKRNLLICGPTGVGKSHLAQALGQEAARQGLDVLFTSVQKMLSHLNGGRADGSWERRMNACLRPDLLILCQPEHKMSANQDSKMSAETESKSPLTSFGNDLRLPTGVEYVCGCGG
jgi:DNA replication protein DnaC